MHGRRGAAAGVAVVVFVAACDAGMQFGPFADDDAARLAGFGTVTLQEPELRFAHYLVGAGRHRYPAHLFEQLFCSVNEILTFT